LPLYEPVDGGKTFRVLGFTVNERAAFLKTVMQFGIGGLKKQTNIKQ